MSNDEIRMTKPRTTQLSAFRHSGFRFHSSLNDLRKSGLCSQCMKTTKVIRRKLKEKSYVIHDCGCIDHSLVAWSGEQFLDGRVHPCPAGHCHCHGAGQPYLRAQAGVTRGNEARTNSLKGRYE